MIGMARCGMQLCAMLLLRIQEQHLKVSGIHRHLAQLLGWFDSNRRETPLTNTAVVLFLVFGFLPCCNTSRNRVGPSGVAKRSINIMLSFHFSFLFTAGTSYEYAAVVRLTDNGVPATYVHTYFVCIVLNLLRVPGA